MKKNFTASVLQKIHTQKISPRERYYFICKTVLKILALLFFLLFGMHAMGMVFHLVNNIEFLGFVLNQPRILMKLVWFGVPLFWIVLAITLWGVTEKVAQQTDRAYRIPFWVLGVLALLIQIGGGIVIEQSNMGEKADQMFERKMDWYQGAERINDRMERMPEKGFLGGVVVSVESDNVILLNDMTNKKWKVKIIPKPFDDRVLEEGMKIHMVGEIVKDDTFLAVDWRPARKPMGNQKGDRQMRPPSFERLR
jgi:hypothetical protein